MIVQFKKQPIIANMWKSVGIAVLSLLFAGQVLAYTEICGNGIDDDSSGGDASCPSPDTDGDGFTSTGATGVYEDSFGVKTTKTDCDDTNFFVYPGVYRFCDPAGVETEGYQKCQDDGSFTTCVANATTPLCEATGGGSCYYVDAAGGLDANAGTFAAKWQTLSKIASSGLAANNVVYLFDGTYTGTLNIGTTNNFTIKEYPGEASVILDPSCTSGSPCDYNIQVLGATGVRIEGITVRETYQTAAVEGGGIRFDGTTSSIVARLTGYNHDGENGTNTAGIYLKGDANNNSLHHNDLWDNFNRAQPRNENNRQIVIFTGTGNHIQLNRMRYSGKPFTFNYDTEASGPFTVGEILTFTSPAGTAKLVDLTDAGTTGTMRLGPILTGSRPVDNSTIAGASATALVNGTVSDDEDDRGCFGYKHGDDLSASNVRIIGNKLSNCGAYPIGNTQSNAVIANNTIADCSITPISPEKFGAINIRDLGGAFYNPTGIVVENNTTINCRGFMLNSLDKTSAQGSIIVRGNIFSSNLASHSGERSDFSIGYYDPDADITSLVAGPFLEENNCYYNTTGAVNFAWFPGSPGVGATYGLAGWKAADAPNGFPGYGVGSFEENPSLAAGTNVAGSTNCADKGWNIYSAGGGGGGVSGGSSISAIDSKRRRRCLKWSR